MMELDNMICNYDGCGGSSHRPDREECTPCIRGIMILVGIIGGIIFAAIGVLLFITSLFIPANFAVWVALITALVYLFAILIIPAFGESTEKAADCIRCHLGGIIFGIFGTIFSGLLGTSTILIGISVVAAIIVGLVFFFFAYMIISIFFLIRCITSHSRK